MNYKCRTCRHYGFYQMIPNEAYEYAGEIPCLSCSQFTMAQDNYEPVEHGKQWHLEGEKDDEG